LQLRKANHKTKKQAAQLAGLDEAKSRFFANVSHELRTPLTLLLGPIKTLLRENQLSEKQAKLLQMANHNGRQLEQLVNEILDLRKLEMGQMKLEEKPTELSSFFRRHFAQFESWAHRKQIDFTYEIGISEETVAAIDRKKCRQVVNNLLSNAFKFTPAGGRVSVSLSLHKGKLELAVADSGPGIHPEDLPHLFDRYFQASRPDKPAEGGTGIGLALCREYARLFGGDIEAESTPGKGAAFRLAFPVVLTETNTEKRSIEVQESWGVNSGEGQVAGPSLAFIKHETSGNHKPTILVVEDNPDLQDYIRLILSEKYNVLTADNGREALDCLAPPSPPKGGESPPGALRSSPSEEPAPANRREGRREASHSNPFPIGKGWEGAQVDLILSDLMMPVMDGYQLLEKLKANDDTRHIPVIMLTARAESSDRLKALRIGVDDYLNKPFDEEELLVRIENLLKNQENRRQEAPAGAEGKNFAPTLSGEDRKWLETFEDYVGENLSNDTLTVSFLAQEFAMSESTLLRQLKRLTGLTTNQYLQEIRLNKARQLLENATYTSISQVAAEVGYGDARSFSRTFRKRFGKLPSDLLEIT
ncbi:MAG: response regulator, partial [Lewinellaceae bacterium]|nr:response regulator [Lewinellaceae bacterium]